MSLMWKMIYGCLTGAWGGFIAWLLLDRVLQASNTNTLVDALLNGAIIGMCIGSFMGGFGGLVEQNRKRAVRGLGIGIITGLLGGIGGLLIGEVLYQTGNQAATLRTIGWAIFGLGIGAGEGALLHAPRRLFFGAIGGVLGGVMGSLAFTQVKDALELPGFSRALGFTTLGALLGLFIGLVPAIIKNFIATLKVVSSGRNEGKEILLEGKRVTRIGRDERCELGLYGDAMIQPQHAEVRQGPQGYVIRALGNAPVLVNGQPTTERLLQKNDRIRVGGQEIIFR